MNGLEEIQKQSASFISEKKQLQEQINKIEEKRIELAEQRNAKKRIDANCPDVSELGRQITELGNESQELQRQLDSKFYETKTQINLVINNLIAENIRKIHKTEEQMKQMANGIKKQEERVAKFELQKQEFFDKFGRMPELSERTIKESELQEKETVKSRLDIDQLKGQVSQFQDELSELVKIKADVKAGNWNVKAKNEDDDNDDELYIEEFKVDEMEPIEEITVEEMQPIEELYVEEFKPIEEIELEEFKPVEKIEVEEFKPVEQIEPEKLGTAEKIETEEFNSENNLKQIDEMAQQIKEGLEEDLDSHIMEMDQQIVEKIATEHSKEQKVAEITEPEDIITFEEAKENKVKPIIPLFGQKEKILGITIKFEDKELVYKASMSDGEEVKIYPAKIGEENVLLRDKQNREECKEILINYSIEEYKAYDKKVINKIDPLVCELLIECAERYGYNAQELIYNYAMSFSREVEADMELVPAIVYNFSYIDQTNLTKKEKSIISKICRNANKNYKIDVIENFSGFKKIKYIFKRLFAVNNVNVLPEAKY